MKSPRGESILESQLVLVFAQALRLGLGFFVTVYLIRRLDEAGDDSAEENGGNEQMVPATGPEKAVEADKSEPEEPGQDKI